MPSSIDSLDPLMVAIAPPVGESVVAREMRLSEEALARKVSDQIDEQIKEERVALLKKRKSVKVLLLGQSESGKSTTLKNFQLTYAPNAWQAEILSWRAVIQLNLIRSVNTILEVLTAEMCGGSNRSSPRILSRHIASSEGGHSPEPSDDGTPPFSLSAHGHDRSDSPAFRFTEQHRLLKLRLAPLKRIEKDLQRRLCAGSNDEEWPLSSQSTVPFDLDASPILKPSRPREFFVRSHACWKTVTHRLRASASWDRAASNATEVIAGCQEDMKELWEDPTVRHVLEMREMRLEDTAGFFLNDVERIATQWYHPSDDDVVRARLRTIGVQEHHLTFENGRETGEEWVIYDVGGSRTCRTAWLPYFDDITAVLFLAPISCFDESLAEDPSVNRLEDTFSLWRVICSAPALAKVHFVLLMNKKDLLDKKLRSGVRFRDWVTSFGDRTNDLQTVVKYLRDKFKDICKQKSPEPRQFYGYLTSVIDTKSTAMTLTTIRAGIMQNHLREADMF